MHGFFPQSRQSAKHFFSVVRIGIPPPTHPCVGHLQFKMDLDQQAGKLQPADPRMCLADATANIKGSANEKKGGSGVTSTLGTWYAGVVMGVLLSFNEAAILYRYFNSAPSQKQNIIVFAANNSRCCECHVAPTIIL
jgi:hypothetical protein